MSKDYFLVSSSATEQTEYYSELVVTESGNTDVEYKTGSIMVPDFVFANDGSFISSLIAL